MSISVFNTKKFKENLFYVRTFNAIVAAMTLLPFLMYYCAECQIQGVGEFLCMLGLSLMIFGIPIIGIVAFINDIPNQVNNAVRIIITILLSTAL